MIKKKNILGGAFAKDTQLFCSIYIIKTIFINNVMPLFLKESDRYSIDLNYKPI